MVLAVVPSCLLPGQPQPGWRGSGCWGHIPAAVDWRSSKGASRYSLQLPQQWPCPGRLGGSLAGGALRRSELLPGYRAVPLPHIIRLAWSVLTLQGFLGPLPCSRRRELKNSSHLHLIAALPWVVLVLVLSVIITNSCRALSQSVY